MINLLEIITNEQRIKLGGMKKRLKSENILKTPGNRINFGRRYSYGHSSKPRSSLLRLQMSKNQRSNGTSVVGATKKTANKKLFLKKKNDMIAVLKENNQRKKGGEIEH